MSAAPQRPGTPNGTSNALSFIDDDMSLARTSHKERANVDPATAMDLNNTSTLRLSLSFSAPPSAMSIQCSPEASIYFGYGSNLWLQQMHERCPTSKYLGVARLNGYQWLINTRGYANIAEASKEQRSRNHEYANEVWGLVYSLEPADEERLDGNEGVPIAYTKEFLECDLFEAKDGNKPDVAGVPKEVDMLVYINRKLTTPSKPKKEYIYRMNMGINDALEEGVPKGYVDKVMRKFIPDVEDQGVVEVARRQALQFEDEKKG